ncbi:MAG: Xaa-Pro peptidase family protein [Terriglobia bacterium]
MEMKDQERVSRIQASLKEAGLDAFILFHPDNILLATGMLPGCTHVIAIVTQEGKVLVVTPWWRESFVHQESWADEVWTFDWCKPFSGVEPISALQDRLRLAARNLRLEKVGFDAKMHHYSPNKLASEFFTYDEIKDALPKLFASAVDATDLLNRLKSLKTPREIAKLRLANQVAGAGVLAFYAHARAGIRETELAAEVNYAILKKAGHGGIRYTYCDPPQIASGKERTLIADTMSNHATERVLQAGDPVLLEFGVQADGYWADITRTLVVGGPSDRHVAMHEAILAAQQNAIAAYRPGKSTGNDLCAAAWDAMKERGFESGITHFLGHGLGFAYHEDRPFLGMGEKVAVKPGNVTSIEPGLYWHVKDEFLGGMRIEENVVWGDRDGEAEILSDFWRGLGTP